MRQQSAAGGSAPAWPRKGHFLAPLLVGNRAKFILCETQRRTATRRVSLASLIRLVVVASADSRRKMQLSPPPLITFLITPPANKIICNIARVGNEQQNASQRILIPAKCNYNLPWHSQTKTFLAPQHRQQKAPRLHNFDNSPPASAEDAERKEKNCLLSLFLSFILLLWRLSANTQHAHNQWRWREDIMIILYWVFF